MSLTPFERHVLNSLEQIEASWATDRAEVRAEIEALKAALDAQSSSITHLLKQLADLMAPPASP